MSVNSEHLSKRAWTHQRKWCWTQVGCFPLVNPSALPPFTDFRSTPGRSGGLFRSCFACVPVSFWQLASSAKWNSDSTNFHKRPSSGSPPSLDTSASSLCIGDSHRRLGPNSKTIARAIVGIVHRCCHSRCCHSRCCHRCSCRCCSYPRYHDLRRHLPSEHWRLCSCMSRSTCARRWLRR